jgi:hypothetical protein
MSYNHGIPQQSQLPPGPSSAARTTIHPDMISTTAVLPLPGKDTPHYQPEHSQVYSSTRDNGEISGALDWDYRPPPPVPRQHPWEEGYRGTPNTSFTDYAPFSGHSASPSHSSDHDPQPKRRKRGKKGSIQKSTEDMLEGIEGELTFENPSGDPTTGLVYVHPPKGTAQACVRCHKVKRKCDNGRPRCAACTKADVACVFELSPATSG